MAKKITKQQHKELIKNGIEPNEKPKTKEEEEIERLMNLGKPNGKKG